jgi:hypothetical protein
VKIIAPKLSGCKRTYKKDGVQTDGVGAFFKKRRVWHAIPGFDGAKHGLGTIKPKFAGIKHGLDASKLRLDNIKPRLHVSKHRLESTQPRLRATKHKLNSAKHRLESLPHRPGNAKPGNKTVIPGWMRKL